jgi:hypothetical protein
VDKTEDANRTWIKSSRSLFDLLPKRSLASDQEAKVANVCVRVGEGSNQQIVALAGDQPGSDSYGDVVVAQSEVRPRASARIAGQLPFPRIDSVRDDVDAAWRAELDSKEEIANMLGDRDRSVGESAGQSLCAADRLAREEAMNAVKRRNRWNSSKPCNQLPVQVPMQQVRVDEVRSEATDLYPQGTENTGAEIDSSWNVYDFHPSLAHTVHELATIFCRRRPHLRLDPNLAKSRKQREQVPFAAPDALDLLHVKDAHGSIGRAIARPRVRRSMKALVDAS